MGDDVTRIRLLIAGHEITDFAPNEPMTVGDYTSSEAQIQYTHKPTGTIGTGTSPEVAMVNLASNLQDAGIEARVTTKVS